jgi:hypothetical protein
MRLCEDISFEHFLLDLKIDEETCWHILGLWYIIQKSTLFLKRKPNDICTNVFGIHVGPLWGANTNAQYIFRSICSNIILYFLFNQNNNSILQKLKIILDKYKHDKQTKASKHIKKLENAFLNAQQMSTQQVVHITISIPLYHSTRSFQFINTCQQQDRTFVLLPQKNTRLVSKFYNNTL